MSGGLDILVADDDAGVRMSLAYGLSDAGHRVVEALDGARVMTEIARRAFDVAILDVRLPMIDGMALFRQIRKTAPRTAIILMTAFGRVADAVAALQEGAYDYVTKPFEFEAFQLGTIGRIAERQALRRELDEARAQLAGRESEPLIGRSPAIERLRERIDTLAGSDAPVLITGESGTGKELVARALHQRSRRSDGPFVALNCAALPESLIEAELFGHERGAFTGAVKRRDGRFKHADGGTLLLDEIGELPPLAQGKLLRVLQDCTVEPIGSDQPITVDVRVISATHRNLKEEVAAGRLREDLYYRLNVLDVAIAPLREREGDLPLLLEHFLRRFTPPGRAVPGISTRAWRALERHPFPGNVREFAHAVERAVVLARGREIDLEHLPPDVRGASGRLLTGRTFEPLAGAVQEFERQHILRALELTGGKRARAAELLGISRKSLWERLRALGVAVADEDAGAPSANDAPSTKV